MFDLIIFVFLFCSVRMRRSASVAVAHEVSSDKLGIDGIVIHHCKYAQWMCICVKKNF